MAGESVIRRVGIKNILFTTDFSEPSDLAIPYAASLARGYNAGILALHVLTDVCLDASGRTEVAARVARAEQAAADGMARIHSQLTGLEHETLTVHDGSVWSAVRRIVEERNIDLIVAGSHRRLRADGLMPDSIAEEIFRRASVPVLVVGPESRGASHNAGLFRRILFATDFSQHSAEAAAFAVSLAEENDSKLLLLHVLPSRGAPSSRPQETDTVAHAMHLLHAAIPADAEFWCRPEATVRFGDPAARVLEVASEFNVDLIVLGVRKACCGKCATSRPAPATARAIVAGAKCPVLAVRAAASAPAIFRVNCMLDSTRPA